MFCDINQYILLSKEERQKHVDLKEACIEIGGRSDQFRALLAHFLNTTIPFGRKIHLCHVCGNGNVPTLNIYIGGQLKKIKWIVIFRNEPVRL